MNPLEQQLLQSETGAAEPRLRVRTGTRVDTGRWWRRSPVWLCATDHELIMLAVARRRFFARVADVATTERTQDATIIQTRHRIPEAPLSQGQIMVYQVPQPEPLRFLEPRETETRAMHAYEEYGLQYLSLYESVSAFGRIAGGAGYPVLVDERYLMSPSPIPKFDNPKLHQSEALHLFGAGREKRIYAVPPHTDVRSLDFEDYPFDVQSWDEVCGLCGCGESYKDEVILDDEGARMFVCSDSAYCGERREAGHAGPMAGHALDSVDSEEALP